MKFSVPSAKIARHLRAVSTVIGTKNMLPILDHVLLNVSSEGILKITATDIQTSLRVKVEVENAQEGAMAIPYKMLMDTLNTFESQPLDFERVHPEEGESDGETTTFSLKITSSQGTYQMMCCDPDDFPEFKEVEDSSTFTLNSELLAKALKETLHSCSTDDMKINLNGVFFNFRENEMNFVSTDGHILSKHTVEKPVAEGISFSVDKKPLTTLKSLISELEEDDKEISIEFNSTNVKFMLNGIEITCSLIEGKFPDYKSIIPKDNDKIIEINRVQLLNSIRRLSIFSDKITNIIKVSVGEKGLEISAEDAKFSNLAKETVSCSFNQKEPIDFLLSSKRTQQILSNIASEDVMIKIKDRESIILFAPVDPEESDSRLSILCMPLL